MLAGKCKIVTDSIFMHEYCGLPPVGPLVGLTMDPTWCLDRRERCLRANLVTRVSKLIELAPEKGEYTPSESRPFR